jgi:DNA-directed RNA polymerase subunit RPC12/RpoP
MKRSNFIYLDSPENICYKYKCLECGRTILSTIFIIPIDPLIKCKCGSERVEYLEE